MKKLRLKKKYTSYRANSFRRILSEMRLLKMDFLVTQTGYTSTIETEDAKIYFYEPSESGRRKRILELRQIIISDIEKCDIVIDKIPASKVRFFELGSLLKEQSGNDVQNVDISAAYPTCLYNYGFITKETYDLLMAETKTTRLKAIGSIATKKLITVFKKGRPQVPIQKTNDQTRNVFFLLCYEIGEIMFRIRRETKSFLFFWFDGIYFTDETEKEKIICIMNENNYLCKHEILKDFTVKKDMTRRMIYIKYLKGEENKPKVFNLPIDMKIHTI